MAKLTLTSKTPPKGTKGLGKAQVISRKSEIEAALDKGWTAKDIWEDMRKNKQISIGYRAFLKHVANIINKDDKQTGKSGTDTTTGKKTVKSQPSEAVVNAAQIGTEEIAQKTDNKESGPKRGDSFNFNEVVRPEAGHNVSDDELF